MSKDKYTKFHSNWPIHIKIIKIFLCHFCTQWPMKMTLFSYHYKRSSDAHMFFININLDYAFLSHENYHMFFFIMFSAEKKNTSNIQMNRCCSCEIKIALKTSSGFILLVSYFLPLGSKDKAWDRRGQQSVPPSGIYMHNSALT